MKKIHFRLHPAGAAVFAAASLLMDSHEVLAAAAALIAHEAAHMLCMLLCGMRECYIELTPFGGMADVQSFESYSPSRKVLAAVSGILMSTLLSAVMYQFKDRNLLAFSFYRANLSLALLNAFPAWPLDGARTLAAAAGFFSLENQFKKMLVYVSYLTGFGLVILGLYGIWIGIVNWSVLVIGPYLCYAAGSERVYDRVRKLSAVNGKFEYRPTLPVQFYATTVANPEHLKRIFIRKLQYGRYLLLLQLDPVNGTIRKYWTEKDLLNSTIDHGMNCRNRVMDKNTGL